MTGSRLALGLAAASVALCLVIVLELFGSRPAALASQKEVSIARPGRDLTPDLSATPNRHEAMLHDVLARPLFNPDRRPVETGVADARGLPRLTGIVVAGSQRVAIFADDRTNSLSSSRRAGASAPMRCDPSRTPASPSRDQRE
jgi:hypothetical protein